MTIVFLNCFSLRLEAKEQASKPHSQDLRQTRTSVLEQKLPPCHPNESSNFACLWGGFKLILRLFFVQISAISVETLS